MFVFNKTRLSPCEVRVIINTLTPRSDQHEISLYNINSLSSRQVMRIANIINYGLLPWCKTKFSELTLLEMYGH